MVELVTSATCMAMQVLQDEFNITVMKMELSIIMRRGIFPISTKRVPS